MNHVGLDKHDNQSVFHVLNENGIKIQRKEVKGSTDVLIEELKKVKKPFDICFEASTGYGYLYEKLLPIASSVQVAHPKDLHLIFRTKRKTDRIDAEKLAKLLALNAVPVVHVPPAEVRSWRGLIEHRHRLVTDRTRIKNRLRALLRTHNLKPPCRLWTQKGYAWLEELSFPIDADTLQKDLNLERIRSMNSMIKRVEKELKKMAQTYPGVSLLMTIPGVGIRTAEAVVAYVSDPGRFRRIKNIGSYFGLVPCEDTSAGIQRLGHITKEGPSTVRKLLIEAAWQGIRRSQQLKAFFERVKKGNPDRKKIALVATAHYLLRVMLSMLQTGEVWRQEEDAAAS